MLPLPLSKNLNPITKINHMDLPRKFAITARNQDIFSWNARFEFVDFVIRKLPVIFNVIVFKIPTDIPNNTHHNVLLLESLPLQLKVHHPLLPLKNSLLLR
jgi:hypothetical protein